MIAIIAGSNNGKEARSAGRASPERAAGDLQKQFTGAKILYEPRFDTFRPRIREQVELSKTNWFRVGGLAEFVFRPQDAQDLAAFFRLLPHDVPVTVLGVGSNVIVRDGGIDGVVIKLGRGFAGITVGEAESRSAGRASVASQRMRCDAQLNENGPPAAGQPASWREQQANDGGNTIIAGGGALDVHVAAVACAHGLSGLEFLCGIPGTIGGAVRMNAGAYGADISHVLKQAQIVERNGIIRMLTNKELGFVYRNSALPEGAVVTQALLFGIPGDKEGIQSRMNEISSAREGTQPVRSRTGGSTFKNPEGHKAWQLIEQAGCRGLRIGGAQVSGQHCNFLINTGDATAADLENLGEEVRKRVQEKTGILLEWEIKRIGKSS
ncbi:MAG: UDP-N-acetylmuramate dehydrogenase [Alphaproteobacteria bacterium]